MKLHNGRPEQVIQREAPGNREDNLQYNRQDMDQEQKLDLKPVMQNSQNLHFHINSDVLIYCGKITGTVCSQNSKTAVANSAVRLFFGSDSGLPVYQTNTDANGNFAISEIPPGYYIVSAEHGRYLKYRSHYIKVLPCQTAHVAVFMESDGSSCYYCQKK